MVYTVVDAGCVVTTLPAGAGVTTVAGAGAGCITVRSVLLQATTADMQITAAANRALDVMVVSLSNSSL